MQTNPVVKNRNKTNFKCKQVKKKIATIGQLFEIQLLLGNFKNEITTFLQLLNTFIGNFLGIYRLLVARPSHDGKGKERNFSSSHGPRFLSTLRLFLFLLGYSVGASAKERVIIGMKTPLRRKSMSLYQLKKL